MITYLFVCTIEVKNLHQSILVSEKLYSFFEDINNLEIGVSYEGGNIEILSVITTEKIEDRDVTKFLHFLERNAIKILHTNLNSQKEAICPSPRIPATISF